MNLSPPPHRILVMEDEPPLLDIFVRALRRAGYDVYPALTLGAAQSLLEEHFFALWICDIHMGHERTTSLLAQRGASLMEGGTQIVVMSAEAQYRPFCAEMGIDFYLEKPILPDTLVVLVTRLLRHLS